MRAITMPVLFFCETNKLTVSDPLTDCTRAVTVWQQQINNWSINSFIVIDVRHPSRKLSAEFNCPLVFAKGEKIFFIFSMQKKWKGIFFFLNKWEDASFVRSLVRIYIRMKCVAIRMGMSIWYQGFLTRWFQINSLVGNMYFPGKNPVQILIIIRTSLFSQHSFPIKSSFLAIKVKLKY